MLVNSEHTYHDDVTTYQPGIATKLLYTLAVLSFFPLALVGSSGWVALATGSGSSTRWALIAVLLFGLWRILQVWRYRHCLDAELQTPGLRLLRWFGMALMGISVLAALSIIFQGALASALFRRRSDDGIEFFVLSLIAAFIGVVSAKGILFFELSRLLSFERWRHLLSCEPVTGNAKETINPEMPLGKNEPRAFLILYGILLLYIVGSSVWSVLRLNGKGDMALAVTVPTAIGALWYAVRLYSIARWQRGFVRWIEGAPMWLRGIGLLAVVTMAFSWVLYWLLIKRHIGTLDVSTRLLVIRAFTLANGLSGYGWLLFDFARLVGFEQAMRTRLEKEK